MVQIFQWEQTNKFSKWTSPFFWGYKTFLSFRDLKKKKAISSISFLSADKGDWYIPVMTACLLYMLQKFLTFCSRKVLEVWHKYPEHLCSLHTEGAKALSRNYLGWWVRAWPALCMTVRTKEHQRSLRLFGGSAGLILAFSQARPLQFWQVPITMTASCNNNI